jgi:hypothetical protein
MLRLVTILLGFIILLSALPSDSATLPTIHHLEIRDTISMDEVKSKGYTIISGKVYDVSGYASRHPGGAGRVNAMKGTDGTQRLKGKHGLGYVSFLKKVGDFSGGGGGAGGSGTSNDGGDKKSSGGSRIGGDLFKMLLGSYLKGGDGGLDWSSIFSGMVSSD